MLIRDDGKSWTAIGQPAHAWLAAQVARHWLPAPSEEVILGVEQHDIAWIDSDRRPPLHAEAGRAAAFFEASAGLRLEIWREAALRLVEQSPYAALLVSLHATNIHTRYRPPEDAEALLARQGEIQGDLLARTGAERGAADRDADLLFALDAFSLTLCHDWPARELPAVAGVEHRLTPTGAGTTWTLDPWPLDVDELEIGLDARCLTERFDDEAILHAALDATPYECLHFTLRAI
jgi:hypothetical protein